MRWIKHHSGHRVAEINYWGVVYIYTSDCRRWAWRETADDCQHRHRESEGGRTRHDPHVASFSLHTLSSSLCAGVIIGLPSGPWSKSSVRQSIDQASLKILLLLYIPVMQQPSTHILAPLWLFQDVPIQPPAAVSTDSSVIANAIQSSHVIWRSCVEFPVSCHCIAPPKKISTITNLSRIEEWCLIHRIYVCVCVPLAPYLATPRAGPGFGPGLTKPDAEIPGPGPGVGPRNQAQALGWAYLLTRKYYRPGPAQPGLWAQYLGPGLAREQRRGRSGRADRAGLPMAR